MGINTTIYSNHNLDVPTKSNEIVELLMHTWKGKIEIFDKIEVTQQNQTPNANTYKVFINPKLIGFEVERFNQITISTNFEFTMNMRLYKNTLCIIPTGIGRYATNMIVEFMNEPFGIYEGDSDSFNRHKSDWDKFKIFLTNITAEIGGSKHLFLNDGKLEGIGDLSVEGKTIAEMIDKANKIVKPCSNEKEFVEHHTWLRKDGIRNIKDDIWFVKELNNEE